MKSIKEIKREQFGTDLSKVKIPLPEKELKEMKK